MLPACEHGKGLSATVTLKGIYVSKCKLATLLKCCKYVLTEMLA